MRGLAYYLEDFGCGGDRIEDTLTSTNPGARMEASLMAVWFQLCVTFRRERDSGVESSNRTRENCWRVIFRDGSYEGKRK